MYVAKIQQQINSSAKIILSDTEKSLKNRIKKVDKLSSIVQKELLKRPSRSLTPDSLKKLLSDIDDLKNLSLNIQPLSHNECHACLISQIEIVKSHKQDHDVDFIYKGFHLEFKEENGYITNPNGEIVHEIRHLLDHASIPKYTLMSNPGLWYDKEMSDKFNAVHSFIMDPKEYQAKKILGFIKKHTFEEELKEKLKVFDNITAIRFLQKKRYRIQTEINAYNDYMLYYARRILDNPRLIIGIPKYYIRNRNEFEFPEKMRVIKKVIKELIQEERTKTKSALLL